jgi:dUTP pyrophosphatase
MVSPAKWFGRPVTGRRRVPWADVATDDQAPALGPSRAYEDDAGFDLYVQQGAVIHPGQVVDIHCGVALELPSDVWVLLIGRSSTLRKRGLMVNPGIIDPGYRGELFAGVMNMTGQDVWVEQGERLAQVIFLPNLTYSVDLVQVDQLGTHARGSNGFGSSGS